MMRILITSIVDLKKAAHNRLHQFVKHLCQNHNITMLSINDWWKASQVDTALYAQGFEDILSNINIRYFTQKKIGPIYQELISPITLGKVLEEINYKQFDVHLNYDGLLSGYFVARKAKSAGIKTVYDIADDLPAMIRSSSQIPAPLRPIGELVGRIVLRRNVGIAERTITITELLRNSLRIPLSKSVVVPNGVDTGLFHDYSSAQLRRELGLDHVFVLGYVGVLREWIDLRPTFTAIKRLKNEKPYIKMLVVGEEGGLASNKALAERYGVSDRVVFAGTVQYSQVPQYISCMDIGLLPMKDNAVSQNALPLKLFEYMACERPIISTRLRGVMEAADGRVLYASDSEEFKQRILDLYNNEELRKKLGAEGRKFVEKNYSWSHICHKLEELLLDVAR